MATPTSKPAAPERTPVVILFAEMRGFTRTSAILSAPVVLARVSEFFALVRASVERQGGTVRNVLNDTLMASFAGKGNARQAVQAAQDIQRDFAQFEESWERDYGIRAAVAIGMHIGDTVIGTAGGPMAGQTFVIGDCVSIAERLLHRARAGEFVLSKAVMDALAAGGFKLDAQALPPLEIPRREPIRMFGVLLDTRLDFT
ncbi:MAG: adenylate/guanylate cyclase domain-containing protein [Betaproteobacteria bacterium]|nr:adenylate/guanylate cyclase domain-containing protein [Betaproteobacteria bacterium]